MYNEQPHFSPAAPTGAISVSELNRRVRQVLEQDFPLLITVEGELSNFASPSSGHWYFTLKDAQAQVRCALFRNRNRYLKYRPKNGDLVRLRARVSLYEGRGEFQLIGDYLEEAGTGALQREFELLKQRLQLEGLFDQDRKRPLPTFPKCIGVVTSPTGAALQDILHVMRRRFAGMPVILYPTAVQGAEAAPQIVAAIDRANRHGACDLLIIGRGGGSLEDLWPFNEEAVARAVAASTIPTLSAVGHEVDFAISDFVADVRAPTPSAAAELATPNGDELSNRVTQLESRLGRAVQGRLQQRRDRLDALRNRLRHPGQRLQDQAQRLDDLELRLRRAWNAKTTSEQQRLIRLETRLKARSPKGRLENLQQKQQGLELRLRQAIKSHLERKKLRLAAVAKGLNTVSPLATLQRGYAIVSDDKGEILRDAATVTIGSRVEARLANGSLQCEVIGSSATEYQINE